MKRAAPWLVYPALVTLALTAVLFATRHGVGPVVALTAVQVAVIPTIALLERWMPEHESWNVARDDVWTDALYFIVSGLLITTLVRVAVFALTPSFALWPARWPLVVQVLFAVALVDLGSYATHVVCHRTRWAWPIHAPHHSAERLYWLNATRMHPLDQASTVVASLLPLALLGAPTPVLTLFDAFASVHLLLQHSNIKLRHGPLSHVVATAEFHRWHHSKKRHESEGNYAAFVSVWDHVFGTFRMPRGEQPPEMIGLYDDTPFPTDFRRQLSSPFRAWRALLRGR